MKFLSIITFFCFIFLSHGANAKFCDPEVEVEDGFLFPLTYSEAMKLSKQLCLLKMQREPSVANFYELNADVIILSKDKFADSFKIALLKETEELKEAGINLDTDLNILYKHIIDIKKDEKVGEEYEALPILIVDKNSNTYNFSNRKDVITEFSNSECIKLSYKKNCYDTLEQLRIALGILNAAKNVIELEKSFETLGLYSQEWDKYFSENRTGSSLEIFFNTLAHRNELKRNKPVLPPNYQILAFHPSYIYEHIEDADSGDKGKSGFALEWVGINFWNQSIPWGVSAVATYTDRDSTDDIGHGLMFHIYNKYSIGITDHSGEKGVFVTMNLFDIGITKKDKLLEYKDSAEKYLKKN